MPLILLRTARKGGLDATFLSAAGTFTLALGEYVTIHTQTGMVVTGVAFLALRTGYRLARDHGWLGPEEIGG